MTPPQDRIDQIKAQFPDRALFLVNAVAVEDKDKSEDQVMEFVMTAPERGEYRLFVDQMIKAREVKDEGDRLWKIREVVENAALNQIRWPSKEECQKAFRNRPEMVDGFAQELQKAAGSNVELRSKKL